MKMSNTSIWLTVLFALVMGVATGQQARADDSADADGWISLFDGRSLDGWTPSEHKESCAVENGAIRCGRGGRSHLFYTGPVNDHNFKNFELKAEVRAEPGSNSGIYFHTEFQEEDWPAKGYEAQVNSTESEIRKTGSLYGVDDVHESPVNELEWFNYHIIVDGKRIILKVNGETTVDYTEPDNPDRPDRPGRLLSDGTIALQAHDPGSVVYFRNIRLKPLP
jgi:hypothetical protein